MVRKPELKNWNPVFNDDHLNGILKDDGIVKVKLNGFSPETVDNFLQENVAEYPEKFESVFYGNFLSSDFNLKRKICTGLSQLIDPLLDPILLNQETLSYFFIVKGKGNESEVNIHQDWSIVDERKYRSFTLWIPLVDCTTKNGTLYAIKGSHKLPLNIRGGSIHNKYPALMSNDLNHLFDPIVVQKGEALIFDSRLLHYSPSNNSYSSRTSVISNIIPKGVQTILYIQEELDDKQEVFSYDVPHDFYLKYDDFLHEKNFPHKLGTNRTKVNYANIEPVNTDELKVLLGRYARSRKKWSFFSQ